LTLERRYPKHKSTRPNRIVTTCSERKEQRKRLPPLLRRSVNNINFNEMDVYERCSSAIAARGIFLL